jgi:hypothetical protein
MTKSECARVIEEMGAVWSRYPAASEDEITGIMTTVWRTWRRVSRDIHAPEAPLPEDAHGSYVPTKEGE